MERARFQGGADHCGLREAESGVPVKELCRRAGISTVTFYGWKTKDANLEISEVPGMRLLEDENAWLKKIVAQHARDIDALQVVSKKRSARGRSEKPCMWLVRKES